MTSFGWIACLLSVIEKGWVTEVQACNRAPYRRQLDIYSLWGSTTFKEDGDALELASNRKLAGSTSLYE